MTVHTIKFHVGQIIMHKKFAYRGVVFDVDAHFSASEAWYEAVAKSRPPKDAPWYHVLVDGSDSITYVAERHLDASEDLSQVRHPLIDTYFQGYSNGQYTLYMKQ